LLEENRSTGYIQQDRRSRLHLARRQLPARGLSLSRVRTLSLTVLRRAMSCRSTRSRFFLPCPRPVPLVLLGARWSAHPGPRAHKQESQAHHHHQKRQAIPSHPCPLIAISQRPPRPDRDLPPIRHSQFQSWAPCSGRVPSRQPRRPPSAHSCSIWYCEGYNKPENQEIWKKIQGTLSDQVLSSLPRVFSTGLRSGTYRHSTFFSFHWAETYRLQ
jgi:hypothetical protein